jgi:methyl-accepting chemotaxis protein
MEEMSRGIQHIAEASGHASDIAMATSEGAKKGNEMLQAAVRRMESINGTVLKTADELTHLKQRSSEIGGIVNIITDIAVQTNLLSLNASIEAARAGEHGRGFAVVAAEVKKLADESERSAKQIRSLIHGIQADTNVTVASMSEGVREIEEGMRSIRSAGTAFAEIVAASKRLSARIQDIASASEQLSASSEQVSASVSELTGIAKRASERTQLAASSSKEQLAAIEEIAKSSDSMTYVARDLQHIIGMFKIGTE